VDAVVSFETLEHVTDWKKFLCEIKRVLRRNGMVLISVRDAKVDKDVGNRSNRSQVKALDRVELCAILSEHFGKSRVLSQRPVIRFAIVPDSSELSVVDRQQTLRAEDSGVFSVHEGIGSPATLIAVASETALSRNPVRTPE
jgi:SAM-dependent methyltransferase